MGSIPGFIISLVVATRVSEAAGWFYGALSAMVLSLLANIYIFGAFGLFIAVVDVPLSVFIGLLGATIASSHHHSSST